MALHLLDLQSQYNHASHPHELELESRVLIALKMHRQEQAMGMTISHLLMTRVLPVKNGAGIRRYGWGLPSKF